MNTSAAPQCAVCLGPLPDINAACPVCLPNFYHRQLPDVQTPVDDPYVAFRETEPCKRCGEGESWTVKGPDGACIGQSWTGDNAECNAEEEAQALNAAYELGRASTSAKERQC